MSITRVPFRESMVRDSVLPWFREWVAIEQEASALRSDESAVIPGLLQTEDYARRLLEGAGQLAGDVVEQQVGARLGVGAG